MRKDVERHLRKRNCRILQAPKEPVPCDFGRLVDGFLVQVLRIDSMEYHREFWREAYQNGHTIGHVPRTFTGFVRRNAHSLDQLAGLLLSVLVMFGAYAGLAILRERLSRLIRRMRRPTYYERERARRQALAARRRKIRARHTLNPRPGYDAIRSALAGARGSPGGALRCGSLMQDLECFVDNSLRLDRRRRIVGRNGGIKRLLQREAPDLFAKYSTLMRYKAMSKRFRQACGLSDPVPADMLLAAPPASAAEPSAAVGDRRTDRLPDSPHGVQRESAGKGAGEGCDNRFENLPELVPARSISRTILSECEGTLISLEAALALRLDPDCIPAKRSDSGGGPASPHGPEVPTPRGAGGERDGGRTCGRPRVLRRAVEWLLRRRAA